MARASAARFVLSASALPVLGGAIELARLGVEKIRLTRLRPRVGDVPSLDLVVRRLVERGLLHRAARGTYDFSLPMFRAYVRRRQGIFRMFHDPKDWRPHPAHPWPGTRADEQGA
jgi:hypothetical protein